MGVVDEVLLSLQTTIGVVLPFRRIWGFWSLPNLSANCWPPLATQKHFTNMLTVSVYWNYALPRAAQTFFNRSSIFGWHSAEPEKNWLHLSCSSDLQLSRNLTKPSAKKNKHAVYSLVADLKFCSASATDGKEQFAIYYTVLIVVVKNIIVTIEITFFLHQREANSIPTVGHTHAHTRMVERRKYVQTLAWSQCTRAMRETMSDARDNAQNRSRKTRGKINQLSMSKFWGGTSTLCILIRANVGWWLKIEPIAAVQWQDGI